MGCQMLSQARFLPLPAQPIRYNARRRAFHTSKTALRSELLTHVSRACPLGVDRMASRPGQHRPRPHTLEGELCPDVLVSVPVQDLQHLEAASDRRTLDR